MYSCNTAKHPIAQALHGTGNQANVVMIEPSQTADCTCVGVIRIIWIYSNARQPGTLFTTMDHIPVCPTLQ